MKIKLPSNKVAYISRLLNDRYLTLQGVLTTAHLDHQHRLEAGAEMQLIEMIQAKLVPK